MFSPARYVSKTCFQRTRFQLVVGQSHRVQRSQFHQKQHVIYDETLLSSVKTHFQENLPMILCEIRHVSRIFIDFPKSTMNVHDSSVPHRFSSMFSLHRCSPVISAHSSHVFIHDATISMIVRINHA